MHGLVMNPAIVTVTDGVKASYQTTGNQGI